MRDTANRIERAERGHERRHAVRALAAAAMALAALPAMALPPEKPFDPRPLLPAAEKQFPGEAFTFVVMGDSKNNQAVFGPLMKRAEQLKPAFVLLIGDMVAKATPDEYDRLEKNFGPFARRIASFPCCGNHDIGGLYSERFFENYVKFWGIGVRHYSFDFKNARMITLEAANTQPTAAELAWLEGELAAGQKAGKLLFLWQHVPAYTVGAKPAKEVPNRPTAFTKLCTKYGVLADFAGHDHSYYRTKRDAATYIICAVAGAGIYPGARVTDAQAGDVFAVGGPAGQMILRNAAGEKPVPLEGILTEIRVEGRKVTGRAMTASGTVIDEFTLADPAAPGSPTTQPAAGK